MKILKVLALVAIVGAVIVALLAPVGPLPGFFIGGNEAATPASWGDTRGVQEVKLSVGNGALPRVVIVWVVQVDGDLHVVGAKDSGWTSRLGAGGPVQLRLGDQTYGLQAERLNSGWENVLEAYVEKYQADYPEIVQGFPSVEEAAATTAVYRLSRA